MAVFTIYQNAQSCRNSNQADFTHLALLNIFLKEKFRVITFPGSNFGDSTRRDGRYKSTLATSVSPSVGLSVHPVMNLVTA